MSGFKPKRRRGLTANGALAIDVRRDVAYLVHVEARRGKPTRARFRREPIDQSLYSENPLEAAAAAIGRMTHGLDLRKIPATLVLPNNREAVRVKRFPPLKKRALAAAADIAMRADVFSASEETVRRHFVQKQGQSGEGTRFDEVVLLEAGLHAVQDAEALARLAGLRLVRVSSPALSLGRAVAAICPPSKTCLVVDLFGPGTTLNVYAGDRFLLSREGDVGADYLSGDLETFLELADSPVAPKERAEEAGVQTRRAPAAVAVAEPTVDATLPVSPKKLATEIERSNRYLVAQFRHTIDAVYFAGASALGQQLSEQLARHLDIPIALLAPEGIVPADALEGAPTCSAARCLGAALDLLAPARARRYDLLATAPVARRIPLLPITAAAAVLLVGAPLGLAQWRLARADGKLASLQDEAARASAALAPMGNGVSAEDALARADAYRRLRAGEPRWSLPLAAVSAALPEGVWLTGIGPVAKEGTEAQAAEDVLEGEGGRSVTGVGDGGGAASGAEHAPRGPRIALSGRSRTFEGIFSLIARLEESGLVADPRLVSLQRPGVASVSGFAAAAGPEGNGVPAVAVAADGAYAFLLSARADLYARSNRPVGKRR